MMYFLQDFEAIGIDKRGYRLRILKAAAKLPSFSIHVDVPVRESLRNIPGIIYISLQACNKSHTVPAVLYYKVGKE